MSVFEVCIGHESEVQAKTVKQFDLPPTSRGMPRRGILIRDLDGSLRAYVNVCMHLPVPLSFTEDGFWSPDKRHLMCRTHGALYRPSDGYCVEGPCQGLSLDPLEVLVDESGQVTVQLRDKNHATE